MNAVDASCGPDSFKSYRISIQICLENYSQVVIGADDWNWICFSTSFYKKTAIRIIDCNKTRQKVIVFDF